MHKRITLLFPAYVILLGCLAFPAHAAKTDIVVLINGNAVTGEVKALEFGHADQQPGFATRVG